MCWDRFALLLDHLEARAPLSGFWIGNALSVADIAIFAQLQSLRTELTSRQAAEIAARRRLSSWLDRVDYITLQSEALPKQATMALGRTIPPAELLDANAVIQ